MQRTILLVEDDHTLRILGIAAVEIMDLSVIACESAAAALLVLEAQAGSIALLFTDINMPGDLDGVGLIKEVRSRWPRIPVLVTSGKPPPALLKLDDLGFLPKPWTLAALHRAITQQIQGTIPEDH